MVRSPDVAPSCDIADETYQLTEFFVFAKLICAFIIESCIDCWIAFLMPTIQSIHQHKIVIIANTKWTTMEKHYLENCPRMRLQVLRNLLKVRKTESWLL